MITTPYSIFTDMSVLNMAHNMARKAGRGKNSIVKFEWDLLGQLARLQRQLINKTYRLAPYFRFHVFEPKPRIIYALEYRDRIVQHVMCDNILEPYFSSKIIYDNAGCVKKRGQHFAVKRLKKFLKCHYHTYGKTGYYLKVDIKKFYPSLSHEVIKNSMSNLIVDEDVKNLFNLMVDSFETPVEFLIKNGVPVYEGDMDKNMDYFSTLAKATSCLREHNAQQLQIACHCERSEVIQNISTLTPIKRGVPIGNQTSQIIGMYYLNPIDRLVKEKLGVKHYIRYMDDFILVHRDREFLKSALEQIKQKLWTDLKLVVNNKTQIAPLKNGINFLGNRVVLTDKGRAYNRIVPRTVKKFKMIIKKFNKDPDLFEADKIKSTIASYKGHFKHSVSKGKATKIAKRLNVSVKKKSFESIMAEIAGDEMF